MAAGDAAEFVTQAFWGEEGMADDCGSGGGDAVDIGGAIARGLPAVFGVALFGSLIGGPSLAFSIYLGVSIKLRRMVREMAAEGNDAVAGGAAAMVATPIWFGAYAASWAGGAAGDSGISCPADFAA